jgi:sulfate adenylyltransferase
VTNGPAPSLIPPYRGDLIDLQIEGDARAEVLRRATELPSIQLSERSLCDLELLATGGFSPLDRFMGRASYRRVLEDMRLADGTLFPIPLTLPVSERALLRGDEVVLRDAKNDVMAIMAVEEVFEWDRKEEARRVYGTTDTLHPLVSEMESWGNLCVSGALTVVNLPRRYDFVPLRGTPVQVRARLAQLGHANVVAFQTRNPIHRSHEELTKRAAARIDGTLLIHPVVGLTKPGDVDHYSRVRAYRALVERYYDPGRTLLSLLPLAMRMAGPREAIWHAIIRRNYGASHFIVGRDHAGPGLDAAGRPFYGPYDAQALLAERGPEIGVTMVPFGELVYLPDEDRYEERGRIPAGVRTLSISGSQLRTEYLAEGRPLPEWFTRPETATVLEHVSPPRHRRGFCVWFTGLSGAGKSTIAEILAVRLLEHGRQVTVLDGDVVRTHLSKGLGFSKEDRDTNIRRIGFVAAEIVRHRGAVICAAVSPYEATRNECRALIGADDFVLVHVDTPLHVCEARDTKGMYARARRGELKDFTGIDDPYEPPLSPAVVLTTTDTGPEACAQRIVDYLTVRGLLAGEERVSPR